MSQSGSPTHGSLALARAPAAAARGERRALLLWRGFAGTAVLAAYTAVGLVGAVLALGPIVGRRMAARRAGVVASPQEPAGPDRQALPG